MSRHNPPPLTVPRIQPRPPPQALPPAPQHTPQPQPIPQPPPPPSSSEESISIPSYIPVEPPRRAQTPPETFSYASYGMTMRKPVVYLFPPRPLPEVAVSVRLVPQWSFTHIYPPVEPKREPDGRQAISWTVSASPDGTLVEHGTALELAYLFWEAAAAAANAAPPSPPLSPADGAALVSTLNPSPSPSSSSEYFDPAAPLLDPSSPTAVLLPFAALLPYLDGALQRLTLHTAARTDFVTYWLPLLAKQPFVALRFLPQPVYERAAELVVHPAPDVVTRVMMLFRGVPAAAAESDVWAAARRRVGEVDWASVVGVKPEATDKGRFRVLEWGAMEVL
uniref:Calcium-transporting ATPase (EC) n=1 Tax=Ganoderma boninense TaxID=34458 RepID=A0A5K1K4Y0_9APHY|nr:Calcium-transporting ATPase (EC [Ganoderma boninense]